MKDDRAPGYLNHSLPAPDVPVDPLDGTPLPEPWRWRADLAAWTRPMPVRAADKAWGQVTVLLSWGPRGGSPPPGRDLGWVVSFESPALALLRAKGVRVWFPLFAHDDRRDRLDTFPLAVALVERVRHGLGDWIEMVLRASVEAAGLS